jgi:hypothetical protein
MKWKSIFLRKKRIGTIFNLIDRNIPKPWLLRFNDEEHYYFAVDTEGNIIVVTGHCDKFRPAGWVK